ncbi:hypothetical protein [Aegicerativicinus sediminis]|uniref:hypothetical protein n=1 Tax=Aegicerativicinus sediminis TaxID=2893202 RepID=UPI001E589ACE|nr:hypothetical protein [Aegicerativicinus sediminis]
MESLKNSLRINTTGALSKSIVTAYMLIAVTLVFGQETKSNQDGLLNNYTAYTKLPRELVYVHLNKTHFTTGETAGFTIYCLEKRTKLLSKETRNIYLKITNEKGEIVKEKLLAMYNGLVYDNFLINEELPKGKYTLTAYTNYQRNFNEPNAYKQYFHVIDPFPQTEEVPQTNTHIDIQVLPEGGHLLLEANNSLGIIAKDSKGLGVANLQGTIETVTGEYLTSFSTNQFGIAKCMIHPLPGEKYVLKTNHKENQYSINLPAADHIGFNLMLSQLKGGIAVAIQTNNSTLPRVADKPYYLLIHNGSSGKTINFSFKDELQLMKYLETKDLYTGINILTFFDDQNRPILERLYFNYEGVDMADSELLGQKFLNDSINIKLTINDFKGKEPHNLSISVLPIETKAYRQNQNIISKAFLTPFLKAPVENAPYYFKEINAAKKYEMDMLLMTQGWSSYNWNDLFNNPPKILFPFENGITVNGTLNDDMDADYLIHPSKVNQFEVLKPQGDPKIKLQALFPFGNEKMKISKLTKKGKPKTPSVYLQFTPSKFVDYELQQKVLEAKNQNIVSDQNEPTANQSEILKSSWDHIEQLDEVTLTVQREKMRREKIKDEIVFGNVDLFDDNMRKRFYDIASYLRTRGYRVYDLNGELKIYDLRRGTSSINLRADPIVFLDGMQLFDTSILLNFDMRIVDYVVLNRSGFGEGFRGAGGTIQIFTDPNAASYTKTQQTVLMKDYPLTFSKPEKFYTPKYTSYSNSFFQDYGVIGWFPILGINEDGVVEIQFENHNFDSVKLFIEGVSDNGSFISEEKVISLN